MQIRVQDKLFQPLLEKDVIERRVRELGAQISDQYRKLDPLFLAVLNGSFIFAADLFRALTVPAGISFIKLASYRGTSSSGNVVTAIGLEEPVRGRHIIIVEDIIDTGKTLHSFLPELLRQDPASVKIAAFLTKPEALQYAIQADYVGFSIPDHFVIGYGLDYNGHGRNLPGLYRLLP